MRLFASDPAAGALLLERCVPGESIDTLPDEEMVMSGCALARRLQRVRTSEARRVLSNAVTGVAQRAAAIEGSVSRIGDPLSPPAVRAVVRAHEDVIHANDPVVVCHGDMNPGEPALGPTRAVACDRPVAKRCTLDDSDDP